MKSEATAPAAQADMAVDLFDMLSVHDGPSQNSSENASNDDSDWAVFQR